MLQSELEQCHVDLETDEELFAEKVDELNSLKSNYDTLLQEKERIEQMWTAATETEGQLRQDVGQLLEKLSSLERELSSRDSTIEELRGQLGERGRDELRETQAGESGAIEVCVLRRSCELHAPLLLIGQFQETGRRSCEPDAPLSLIGQFQGTVCYGLWLFPCSRILPMRRYWSHYVC